MSRRTPTPDERSAILSIFLTGVGVNHTAFLMGDWMTEHGRNNGLDYQIYPFDVDDINLVVRERLQELEAELQVRFEMEAAEREKGRRGGRKLLTSRPRKA